MPSSSAFDDSGFGLALVAWHATCRRDTLISLSPVRVWVDYLTPFCHQGIILPLVDWWAFLLHQPVLVVALLEYSGSHPTISPGPLLQHTDSSDTRCHLCL